VEIVSRFDSNSTDAIEVVLFVFHGGRRNDALGALIDILMSPMVFYPTKS